MRSLAALMTPGAFAVPGQPLVGRTVANGQFFKALAEHGSFEKLTFLVGEQADVALLQQMAEHWRVPDGRIEASHLFELPRLLSDGAIDVLHHHSHVERLFDLYALRDRYAKRPVAVSGQIHSLSYPRVHQELSRLLFLPPAPTDGIFCSSTAGQRALERMFDSFDEAALARGAPKLIRPALTHVPLGVDVDSLTGGDRLATRAALKLPAEAVVFVCLARFTEYDKVDLFPLIEVLSRLVKQPPPGAGPVYLLLAGARQGTKTPEMLELWAKAMGVADRVRLAVDFADADKRHLLAAGDVFVSPVDNVQETFGQSVVEALAAGLPVIASDFDGYKDTVSEDVGIRVPTALGADWSELSQLGPLLYERPLHLVLGQSVIVDLSALEQAMRELASDSHRRAMLSKAATARAASVYDWGRVIRSYEASWRERLAQPPSTRTGVAHPLRLDFAAAFGHFMGPSLGPDTRLQRTTLSRLPGTPWVVYPELKELLDGDDVKALLAFVEQPQSWAACAELLAKRSPTRPAWAAGFTVGWAVKHGLLAPL